MGYTHSPMTGALWNRLRRFGWGSASPRPRRELRNAHDRTPFELAGGLAWYRDCRGCRHHGWRIALATPFAYSSGAGALTGTGLASILPDLRFPRQSTPESLNRMDAHRFAPRAAVIRRGRRVPPGQSSISCLHGGSWKRSRASSFISSKLRNAVCFATLRSNGKGSAFVIHSPARIRVA